ncbi:hypothetical protein P280DRAFT_167817 [Massarina eburnea CBS 473.64]|uniref:Extracellular membrane protein CFEM domain-containing protein n=1 Tax=Massarina eburnea CBS 473.64 TaxID=1395130 RepID=A0A6A6RP29_9PLEO|nr:hypothetical protein P280DRAFT_167817 [Massarina eburnea CBS 473.64]
MNPSNPHNQSALIVLAIFFFTTLTTAQIGTLTQDVTTISAFPLQKPCAQSCFVQTGFCPNDILGSKIGCKEHTNCYDSGWQATNDCYCRTDLQKAAQAYLTSCVKAKCSAGDAKIDQSTAGSIYEEYCRGKGYSIAAPATVQASATEGSGSSSGTTKAGSGSPAETGTPETTETSTDSKKKLSISEIVGIVVGSLAGLAFLAITLRIVLKWCGCIGAGGRGGNTQPIQQQQQAVPLSQQAAYPMNLYPEWQQKATGAESEVGPDDSVSVVTAPRLAPTIVSNVRR